MNRTVLSLAIASILATGCGHTALAPHTAKSSTPKAALASTKDEAPKAARDDAASTKETAKDQTESSGQPARNPGDFVVYRFSGSYRDKPLVLSERVVEKSNDRLTMAVTLDDGDAKHEFRVTLDESSAAPGEVVSVTRLEDGASRPMSVEEYESLLAITSLAADENEAELGAEDVLLDVDGSKMPCRKTSYRVRIGKRHATMHTLESAVFAWGNMGGEITTDSGKVIYRAEVVETGHATPGANVATAAR